MLNILHFSTALALYESIRFALPHQPRQLAKAIVLQHFTRKRSYGNGIHGDAALSIVSAYVRHTETRYDALLRDGYDKATARAIVQPAILEQLAKWSA